MTDATTGYLVSTLQETLGLRWIAGEGGRNTSLKGDFPGAKQHGTAGPMNIIHPYRIQIIGPAEQAKFDEITPGKRLEIIEKLFDAKPAAIIIAVDARAEEEMIKAANRYNTPLLVSSQDDNLLQSSLQYHLTHILAERTVVHGVFMEVLGVGVLITGDSAVGKSELALELINRGHLLIADDTPEFARISPDTINGTCPPLLQDFLEIRGLGLLNIRSMFGDSAIKQNKYLSLVVRLKRMNTQDINTIDRLYGNFSEYPLLGLKIPQVTIPVAPGKEIAILVEAAVRQFMQKINGYNAGDDFVERQRKAIEEVKGNI
ncbi:MAG: HPr(Ser) kinase/phosphatase [Gammaproteobacteria bacterium]|nr:HPr(Ser) kinase/phosphatase [Gammaproteobacteria bacterium]